MGEAYIIRRAGGSGTSSGSQVFLQSTEPPYENGGLWVNTELEKYETILSLETGVTIGQALPYQFSSAAGGRTICGDWIYATQNTSNDYGYIYGINLLTGEARTTSRFYIANNEWFSGMSCISDGNDTVVMCATNNSASDDTSWYIYTPSTNSVTEQSGVFNIGNSCRYACNPSGSDSVAYNKRSVSNAVSEEYGLTSISSRIYSKLSTITSSVDYTWSPGAFDGDTFVLYRYSNGTPGRSYSMMLVDVASNTRTQTWNVSTTDQYLYGKYAGNMYLCMLDSNTVWIYNIASGIETNAFQSTSAAEYGSTQCLLGSTFYAAGSTVGTRNIYPLSITGDYQSDTVYIQTTGSQNIATIAKDDKGNFNVPIERVVTFPEGSPVDATAYVSTGEAWTQI